MNSPLSRTLFVRPANMMLTHPLQVLSIAREIAKRSGNKLTRFRAVREPDQQRLLNFGSFTFQDLESANEIINQAPTMQIPMNNRAARNYDTLKYSTEKRQDQEIGLIEIASMIGLPLNISGRQRIRQNIEEEKEDNESATNSEIKYVLSPISESSDEAVFMANVKCERRQGGFEHLKSGKRLFQNRAGFDINLMAERNIEQTPSREMSRLQSSWETFGGFSNQHRKVEENEFEEDEAEENDGSNETTAKMWK